MSTDKETIALSGRKFVIVQCGSFNPPHYLHLRLFEMARDFLVERGATVEGGIISPVSDHYAKSGLLSSIHRLEMCRLAAGDSDWVTLDDWEAKQPKYTPTRRVLDHIQEELRRRSGCTASQRHAAPILVCGADMLDSFNTPGCWDPEDMKVILGKYGIVCIERAGTDSTKMVDESAILAPFKCNIFLVPPTVSNDVSSTALREIAKKGLSLKYLLPDTVITYVKQHRLYRYAEMAKAGRHLTWIMCEPTWGLIIDGRITKRCAVLRGEDDPPLVAAAAAVPFPAVIEVEAQMDQTMSEPPAKKQQPGPGSPRPVVADGAPAPPGAVFGAAAPPPPPPPASAAAGGYDFADESKPMCRYGASCFRKNPSHFSEFRHPDSVIKRVLSSLGDGPDGGVQRSNSVSPALPPAPVVAAAAAAPPVVPPPPPPPPPAPAAAAAYGISATLPLGPTEDLVAGQWRIPIAELLLGEKLGAGAFGEVRKAHWQQREVAVKLLHEQTAKSQKMFVAEAELMCKLRHPNIVECLAACTDPPNLLVVMEFCPGTLSGLIKANGPLEMGLFLSIAHGILCGIAYLHGQNPPIIHRDLKPENILLMGDNTPKIADFGVSREKADTGISMTRIGTPIFCSPEMIAGHGKYNEKCDIYSYALILWSMASGKRPFSGMGEDGADLTPFQVMMKVVSEKLRPPMPDTLPEGIADLIRSCWEQTPEARPNAEMVLDILAVLMEAFSKKQQKQ